MGMIEVLEDFEDVFTGEGLENFKLLLLVVVDGAGL